MAKVSHCFLKRLKNLKTPFDKENGDVCHKKKEMGNLKNSNLIDAVEKDIKHLKCEPHSQNGIFSINLLTYFGNGDRIGLLEKLKNKNHLEAGVWKRS